MLSEADLASCGVVAMGVGGGAGDDQISMFDYGVTAVGLQEIVLDGGDGDDTMSDVEFGVTHADGDTLAMDGDDGDDTMIVGEASPGGLANVSIDGGDGSNVASIGSLVSTSATIHGDHTDLSASPTINYANVGEVDFSSLVEDTTITVDAAGHSAIVECGCLRRFDRYVVVDECERRHDREQLRPR